MSGVANGATTINLQFDSAFSGKHFVLTADGHGGSDLRTRLAIYCTGVRYAGNPTQDPSVTNVAANVTAQGMDTAGNQYSFTVEYAGASDPSFPGLDQVNIVLPAQLDGAGVVSLALTAENTTSNAVTFSEVVFALRITPEVAGAAIVFALIMGLVGGFAPAWHAARQNILNALRG